MKFEDVKSIANGRVWTGEQAMSMKVIDGVGDFEAAVADTARSGGSRGEPTLGRPHDGASGTRPQDSDGFAAGRCFPVPAGAGENAGAAGGILLPVEVGGRR